MDIFAHALWTNAVYYPKYKNQLKDRLWAVFFGIMPDLISFIPATVYSIFFHPKFDISLAIHSQNWVFVWARWSYNYTHSFVTFATVLVLVLAIRKGKMYWPLLGWAFHIVIDIFTHPDFYRTPFLYPLSNYRNSHAISWAEPHFMVINYSAIVLVYLVGYFYYR